MIWPVLIQGIQGDSGPPGAPGPKGVSVSMSCAFKPAAYTDGSE